MPPLTPPREQSLERQRQEQDFHDTQAAARSQALRRADLEFSDIHYLQHESWIAPALARLGDLDGRRVLDLGCGHGMASVVLARRGARVVACDLSRGYVREAATRAEVNRVRVEHVVCSGEKLPFADDLFDACWGNAVLHHLELDHAFRELRRTLKPGGVAVFCEPWGENRGLEYARSHLPYRGKQRTEDESPLRLRDLRQAWEYFSRVEIQGDQLLAMVGRVIQNRRLLRTLTWCDQRLLNSLPHLQRYCRYAIITLKKD